MNNYQIIKDEDSLLNFIDWLPDLIENECYYVALFARKKYCPDLIHSNDKLQLRRLISSKKRLYYNIKQLEVELGSYFLKNIIAPQESLVLYISVNPRNNRKATYSMIKHCTDLLQTGNSYDLVQETYSEIHKSVGTKHYFDIDFDNVDFTITYNEIIKHINNDCLTFVRTRGGFHCLINLKKVDSIYAKTWYKNLTTLEGADVNSDILLPVVGCTQGGFTPYFININ